MSMACSTITNGQGPTKLNDYSKAEQTNYCELYCKFSVVGMSNVVSLIPLDGMI